MKKKEAEEEYSDADAAVIKDEADAEVAYQKTLPHAVVADVPAPDVPPPVDYNRKVLIEGYDGGPPFELDLVVQHMERKFTHDGVHYEHVSETPSGQWVYRAM